jgi:hypothetical protein
MKPPHGKKISKKQQRETDKRSKKAINFAVQHGKDVSSKMNAAALKSGIIKYRGESGNGDDVDDMLSKVGGKAPWDGLTETEARSFNSCAEAHLYALIKTRRDNPKTYDLASFTEDGHVAAPCSNCKQWAKTAFKSVLEGAATYRSESVRGTNRYVAREKKQYKRREHQQGLMAANALAEQARVQRNRDEIAVAEGDEDATMFGQLGVMLRHDG